MYGCPAIARRIQVRKKLFLAKLSRDPFMVVLMFLGTILRGTRANAVVGRMWQVVSGDTRRKNDRTTVIWS